MSRLARIPWVRCFAGAVAGLMMAVAQPSPARAGLKACFAIPKDIVEQGIAAVQGVANLAKDNCEGAVDGVTAAAFFAGVSAVVTALDAANDFGGNDPGQCKAAIDGDIANAIAAVLVDAAGNPSDPLYGIAQKFATDIAGHSDEVVDVLSAVLGTFGITDLQTTLNCACDVASFLINQAQITKQEATDAASCLSGVGEVIAGLGNDLDAVIVDGADALGNWIECGLNTCLVPGPQEPQSCYVTDVNCNPGMSAKACGAEMYGCSGVVVDCVGADYLDADGYCPCPSGSTPDHATSSCICPSGITLGPSYFEANGENCTIVGTQVNGVTPASGFACGFVSGAGQQFCCPAGQIVYPGSNPAYPTCTPACPANEFFNPQTQQCLLCPANTQVSFTAADTSSSGTCLPCPSGQVSAPGGQCGFPVTVKDVNLPICDQGQEINCANGSCTCVPQCSANSVFQNGVCVVCAAGTQPVQLNPTSSVGICQPCPGGAMSDGTVCQYPVQTETAMVCGQDERAVCANGACACLSTAFDAFGLNPVVTPIKTLPIVFRPNQVIPKRFLPIATVNPNLAALIKSVQPGADKTEPKGGQSITPIKVEPSGGQPETNKALPAGTPPITTNKANPKGTQPATNKASPAGTPPITTNKAGTTTETNKPKGSGNSEETNRPGGDRTNKDNPSGLREKNDAATNRLEQRDRLEQRGGGALQQERREQPEERLRPGERR